jgi:hypothetical protein
MREVRPVPKPPKGKRWCCMSELSRDELAAIRLWWYQDECTQADWCPFDPRCKNDCLDCNHIDIIERAKQVLRDHGEDV